MFRRAEILVTIANWLFNASSGISLVFFYFYFSSIWTNELFETGSLNFCVMANF